MSHATLRGVSFILLVFLLATVAAAQPPTSLMKTGGTNNDEGRLVHVAPNGNIILAGYFYGTIDLDPGPATLNLTSAANSRDIFLASYTHTGALNWAFSMGGNGADGVFDMTIDVNNNIYLVGYFNDQIDFDPSAGTASHTGLGHTGNGNTEEFGGDGYVVKYSGTGAYQWVVTLQSTFAEDVESVGVDPQGNVYIGGQYKDVVDFDPSPTGTKVFNSSTDGTGFLAKYSPAGQFLWAFPFGKPGIAATDNVLRGIAVDAQSNVYVTGFFQGTNNDFNPSPTGSAYLSASGLYDAIVAKYDKDGNYKWAINIQSSEVDDAMDITLDQSGNVYVTGYVNGSTIDFDPLSQAGTVTLNNPANSENIFIAKYDNDGNYQWSKVMGSSATDVGWALHVSDSSVYNIGYFSNAVDLNQGASPPVTINAQGNMDLYVVKYDLSGNYKCHFTIGSPQSDIGRDMIVAPSGYLYLTGGYSNNADFDLSSNVLPVAAKGNRDIMLAKYSWPCAGEGITPKDTGYRAITICDTPYTIEGQTITDEGTYTIHKGDSVIILTLTIKTVQQPAFSYFPAITIPNEPVQFNNETKGALTYKWDFGDSTTSDEVNPIHMFRKTGRFKVCLTAYSEVNCPATTCRTIDAIVETVIGLPTGFSPNGDGYNDILYVRGYGVNTVHLEIYNRWGQKIFECNDLDQGWDGSYSGQTQEIDVVGYVLDAVMMDGSRVHKSGNVTIIR